MGKRKSAADWRAFLRGLARSGNARLAAREAGMDVGTAYDRRIKDDRFAARWEVELAKGKARAAAGKARLSGAKAELVVRRSKRGTQLVRVGAGRWHDKAEAVFRATLRRTGCVRAAARACGFSTTALYKRRENYPDFAAAWAADEGFARARLPGLLSAAAIATLDPEIEDPDLPRVKIGEAIAIVRMKCGGAEKAASARYKKPEITIEQARDELIERIAAIKRHRARTGEAPPPLPDGDEG